MSYNFNPSSERFRSNLTQNQVVEKSLEETEMQSAILNLRERLAALEQSCSASASCCAPPSTEVTPCCSSCERVTVLEARIAALESAVAAVPATSPQEPVQPTKLRIVSLNYDTYGPDSILNEQGPYRNALSYGSDAIVKISSTQEFVRFCADWTATVGTVLKVICDAPKLRFEGEGWNVLYEISQGESYTFVKEEDGWKGYAGILLI
jgi:hypothetical protein